MQVLKYIQGLHSVEANRLRADADRRLQREKVIVESVVDGFAAGNSIIARVRAAAEAEAVAAAMAAEAGATRKMAATQSEPTTATTEAAVAEAMATRQQKPEQQQGRQPQQ